MKRKMMMILMMLGVSIGLALASASSAAAQAGGKIAFTSEVIGSANLNIILMNADGSNKTVLISHPAADVKPAFSRDGSKVVFESNRDGNIEIYVVNVDGSNLMRLTNNPADDLSPSFSPDGTRIVFTSNRDGNFEIYEMSAADGSNQTRLTNHPMTDGFPAYSADGKNVGFTSDRDGQLEIYLRFPNGTFQNVTNDPTRNDNYVAFSPDGIHVAISSADISGNQDIFQSDGSFIFSRLTTNPAADIKPSYSPDGSKIAFNSDRDGNQEIYVMNRDGSNQTNRSNSLNRDLEPSWGAATNTAPVANNDNFSTNEDTPLNVPARGVLANDTDTADPITASLVVGPIHASSFALNADGSFSYTPAANFNGTDGFSYRASDGELTSNIATVTITVFAVQDPPDANNDAETLTEDSGANRFFVLVNDTDPEADPLRIISVTQPAHGSAIITDNGLTVTYIPNANYNGADSFTYTIADQPVPPFLRTDTATVNITVTPVKEPPNAGDDAASVRENSGSNAIDVLANDTGTSLTIDSISQPAHGTTSISNGTLFYVPQANYNGTDSFTYTVSNSQGTDTATVSITVTPASPPSIFVTKTDDTSDGVCDADCSLREAIAAAENGDVIGFSALFDTPQVITLTNPVGGLFINSNLTVMGKGANLLTVSGNNAVRVFYNNSAIVTLSGMTISGGNADSGGGIYNFLGVFRLLNSIVTGNRAESAGGIFSDGIMEITGSTISRNLAETNGGGIYEFIPSNAPNPYADVFTLIITNSTVSDNSARDGGGIIVRRSFNITNSTVSGNTADSVGGGILIFPLTTPSNATFNFTNVTVTGNRVIANNGRGGGIWNNFSGTVNLRNTIVAGNTADGASASPDFFGPISASSSFNLIGSNRGMTGITDGTGGNQVGTNAAPINPILAPLDANGGPTQTHDLLSGSPAIDKGKSFDLLTDQRGFTRPFDNPSIPNATGGNGADIGAFEVQAGPTAADVTISGRVLTPDGRGLSNAIVVMTDQHGATRQSRTGSFGYYRFEEVPAGETYVFQVVSKRYSFAPQVVNVTEDLTGLNFTAESLGGNNESINR